MVKDLRVCTAQCHLIWEDVSANLVAFEQKIAKYAGKADVVILPEMFTTGFSMNAEKLAESMDGQTIGWMANQAKKLNAVLTGSLIVKEKGNYFNRLVWMRPDGSFDYYDKRHLFSMAGEHKVYTGGQKRLVTEWKGWKICPLICYDLRFPVWSRNVGDYDLLIYVANWPSARAYAWKNLLLARAIENQAWTIGVNRVGKDKKGLSYSGDSRIIEPSGENIRYAISGREEVHSISLSYQRLQEVRKKFPFLVDRDDFSLE